MGPQGPIFRTDQPFFNNGLVFAPILLVPTYSVSLFERLQEYFGKNIPGFHLTNPTAITAVDWGAAMYDKYRSFQVPCGLAPVNQGALDLTERLGQYRAGTCGRVQDMLESHRLFHPRDTKKCPTSWMALL
jgi:hypothetical protein